MTVKELRQALETMPDDADIGILDMDGSPTVIEVNPDGHNDTESPIVWLTLGVFDGDHYVSLQSMREDGKWVS